LKLIVIDIVDNNFISYGFRPGIVSYVEFLFVVVPSLSHLVIT